MEIDVHGAAGAEKTGWKDGQPGVCPWPRGGWGRGRQLDNTCPPWASVGPHEGSLLSSQVSMGAGDADDQLSVCPRLEPQGKAEEDGEGPVLTLPHAGKCRVCLSETHSSAMANWLLPAVNRV